MFDVSVVVVSWNARRHLIECLKSIEDTTSGLSLEIIVVDNASSDGSDGAVAEHFPHVKLIRNRDNLGFAAANNVAIRESTGRYICLINSDVIVLPGCIGNLVDHMNHYPHIGIAGPRVLNPDGTLQPTARPFPTLRTYLSSALALPRLSRQSASGRHLHTTDSTHDKPTKSDWLTGCFWIVRREALEKVGLLDEAFFMYAEDLDWCRRFWQASWDVALFATAEAIHFGGASSDNKPVWAYVEYRTASRRAWKKHHSRISLVGYSSIAFLHELVHLCVAAVQYVTCRPARNDVVNRIKRHASCIRGALFG